MKEINYDRGIANEDYVGSNVIFSSGVATAFEWYDYALFGHLASIIAKNYFPSDDPTASLLNTFLIFAIGYVMRPIGGIIFGVIGDKYGRRTALSTAVLCMSIPTGVIGLLPSYDMIGIYAPVIMTILRVIQGVSMGGALTGAASFLIEHSPPNRRGFMGSTSMSSLCFGVLLSSLVILFTKTIVGYDNFEQWGWRIPFLLGFFIIYSSLYIKNYTEETPLFLNAMNNNDLSRAPLKDAFKDQKFKMLMSIFINSTGSVIFYLQAIYLVNYLKTYRGYDDFTIHYIINISLLIMIFTTLFSGWVSDRIGRKRLYLINLFVLISSIYFIIHAFEYGGIFEVYAAMIFLSILAALYIGAEPALQADFYPVRVRNTALSLSYNVATTIFGGTTPYVLSLIVSSMGSISYVCIYVLGCCFLSLIGLFFYEVSGGN